MATRAISRRGIQELDRKTIQEFGIPGRVLMENAGRAVCDEILRVLRAEKVSRAIRGSMSLDSSGNQMETPKTVEQLEAWKAGLQRVAGPVAIFCGSGNNGGDGLVIARTLLNAGVNVMVLFIGHRSKLTPGSDVANNFDALAHMGSSIIEVQTPGELSQALTSTQSARVVVDALLGTGLSRDVDGLLGRAIDAVNGLGIFTVSVDLPSGLCPDSGNILGVAVKADLTVTFAVAKKGMYLNAGPKLCGTIHVAEIGIPNHLILQKLAEEQSGDENQDAKDASE